MDDRMRVSDSDREAVTARLRDHFAEGRLTDAELDERVSAALNAKTFGDLRRLTTDLPGPVPAPPRPPQPQWGGPPWRRRHGPRFLPLVLLVLLVALVFPGGWLLGAFFRLVLLFWLAMLLTRVLAGLFYWRMHRYR